MKIYLLSIQSGAIAAYANKEEAYAEKSYYNEVLEIKAKVEEIEYYNILEREP